MSFIELFLTAIALSMDAFAVSVTTGITLRKPTPWQAIKPGLFFGGFQALMPFIGYIAGRSVAVYIEAFDHWIAFGLLALLGGSQTSVFDFTTDNALRSVRVERYELQNGAWKAFGGGSFAVSGEKGRIALTMNPNSGEIRFAVQDDHGTSAIKQAYPEEDLTGLAVATSALSAPTAIVTDQEIPLMIQILDSGDKTVSYSPEYFFHPEEYEKLGCERVYAVTVTFSSDSLS